MKEHVRRSLATVSAVGLTAVLAHMAEANPPSTTPSLDPYRSRGATVIPGTVYDFKRYFEPGGHPDFFKPATQGAGRYVQIAANVLSADGKPVYATPGYKLTKNWTDSALRPIIQTRSYINSVAGDIAGTTANTTGAAVNSAASFAQWFRDAAGVNTASRNDLKLTWQGASSVFAFDGTLDGFKSATAPDYAYTADWSAPFVYEAGKGWYVGVGTNGDAWVYVDDKLVIDGGSAAGAQGVNGIASAGPIKLTNTSKIDVAAGSIGTLSTNSTAAGAITVLNSVSIDADVLVGPGANLATSIVAAPGAIVGNKSNLLQSVTMPVISAPAGMPASVGDKDYKSTTATISANTHFNNLTIELNSTISISGNVVILCDANFALQNKSKIVLLAGATLEVYFKGTFFAGQTSEINVTTADPTKVTFYNLGTSTISLDNTATVYANFASPNAAMTVGQSVHVYGNFIGQSIDISNSGEFTIVGTGGWGHFDQDLPRDMTQRIDLDRLTWLDPARSHQLHVFFANRRGRASHLRLETNMELLNVALPPVWSEAD
jgi:hypothetical protein